MADAAPPQGRRPPPAGTGGFVQLLVQAGAAGLPLAARAALATAAYRAAYRLDAPAPGAGGAMWSG